MPVRKFRSIEEMNAADDERMKRDDPRLIERIESHWKRWRNILPPLDMPRGVVKFRSIEEMNAYREKYEDERIARWQDPPPALDHRGFRSQSGTARAGGSAGHHTEPPTCLGLPHRTLFSGTLYYELRALKPEHYELKSECSGILRAPSPGRPSELIAESKAGQGNS